MDIRIMPKGDLLTPADETYIRDRLYFALAANQPQIGSAEVYLCAIPGFESEGLHHCRVDISLEGGSTAIGDSTESDIYVAIDRAVDRSCSKITYQADPKWHSFSQSGSEPAGVDQLSTAA